MASDDDYALFKVHLEGAASYREILRAGIDIIEFNPANLKVFASTEEIFWLNSIGFRIERTDLSEVIDPSVFGLAGAGLYHTYEEVELELHQVESNHNDIAKVYDIGDSIEGREIWAIKISDNPTQEEAGEPDVLYMGAHHAREWISVEIPMYLVNFLVDNYDNDPRIKRLVDERETWIVPMVNPDGVEYSQREYQMWRKNKRDNNNNGIFERYYDGVDNNRNYGYMWGYDDVGSSPNPGAETYRGGHAFSEPENQAIRDLALHNEFVFAISYHSFGQLMLIPWGYVDGDTPDHKLYTDIAAEMAGLNQYLYGNAKDGIIYNTNGGAIDWLYGESGTLAYTFELGTMFIPPEDQIDAIWLRNRAASLYLLQIADDPRQIYPSINIYTDKTDYSEGDTMEVGLDLTNPHDETDVGVYIWTDLPGGDKHWVVRSSTVTLHTAFNYSNPEWKSYTLPPLAPGDYCWHAVVVDPSTEYVLDESVAPWVFTDS
ncbi:MAG: zinc carboxypeptidase [Candidatus Bathyarchaeota archaeon]|nr:MAG: zinc carboxypeptidase [Candidatus Bathyarchaeota archaeon]